VTSGVDSAGKRPLTEPAGRVPPLRIAFGDRPDAPLQVRAGDPPEWHWLTAVALGARGRYAAAATLLDGLLSGVLDGPGRGRDPGPECGAAHRAVPLALRAHAAVTRAAHLRQVGGHLAARRFDGLGLAIATVPPSRPKTHSEARRLDAADPGRSNLSRPDPGQPAAGLDRAAARVDAMLGLAADAIGLADPALADRLLRAAEPLALEHPSWRPGVRWHWVRAELALSRDRPAEAVGWARRAMVAASEAGAARHVLKSELVLAVAEAGTQTPTAQLVATFAGLSERARRSGLWTLEWPILLQLANLVGPVDPLGAHTYRREAAQIVGTIRRHSDPIARYVLDRSPWVPPPEETELLHLDPYHPAETRRSAHSSRMECKNKP
jgi:hypothetical protein